MKGFVLFTLIVSCALIYMSIQTSDLSSENEKEDIKQFVNYIAKKPKIAATVSASTREQHELGEALSTEDIVQSGDDQDMMINNDSREQFDEEGNQMKRSPTSIFDELGNQD